jgi:hypothetical protein
MVLSNYRVVPIKDTDLIQALKATGWVVSERLANILKIISGPIYNRAGTLSVLATLVFATWTHVVPSSQKRVLLKTCLEALSTTVPPGVASAELQQAVERVYDAKLIMVPGLDEIRRAIRQWLLDKYSLQR